MENVRCDDCKGDVNHTDEGGNKSFGGISFLKITFFVRFLKNFNLIDCLAHYGAIKPTVYVLHTSSSLKLFSKSLKTLVCK